MTWPAYIHAANVVCRLGWRGRWHRKGRSTRACSGGRPVRDAHWWRP